MDGKNMFWLWKERKKARHLCEAEKTMLTVGLHMYVPIYMPECVCVYDFITPKVVQQEEV